jgi:pentatricopeptide repeat protein
MSKNKTMKQYLFIAILALMALSACQNNSTLSNKAIIKNEPKVAKLLERNQALQQGKEWDAVQNNYAKNLNLLRTDSNQLEPKLQLAYLFINEARVTGEHPYYYPAALQLLEGIITKQPEDQDLLFLSLSAKAAVQLSLHQFQEALMTVKQALEINPHNAQVYGILVDAYVELGDYEKAIQMADKMVMIRPDLRSYARISYLREIHGDMEGAIKAMEMAVLAGIPGSEETAWTQLTLGNLYQEHKETDKAEQQYLQILAERPDYPFAIAALASIEVERENFAKAEILLDKALSIIPEVGFTIQKAELYKTLKQDEKALAIAKSVLPMLEEDTEAGHNMNLEFANVYANLLDDIDMALVYANKEYTKRPKNIDVNKTLAELYKMNKDFEKAEKHLKASQLKMPVSKDS